MNNYTSKGINDLKLPARVMKFVRDNIEFHSSGQGVISLSCPKLWEMSEEEFKQTFGEIK